MRLKGMIFSLCAYNTSNSTVGSLAIWGVAKKGSGLEVGQYYSTGWPGGTLQRMSIFADVELISRSAAGWMAQQTGGKCCGTQTREREQLYWGSGIGNISLVVS